MSYILDALRKSEAARRSREAPDLLQQAAAPVALSTSTPAGKYGGRPAWAVAAIGVTALAVALWLHLAGDPAPPADAVNDDGDAPGELAIPIAEGPATDDAPVPPPFAGNAPAGPVAPSPAEIGPVPGMAPVAVPPPVLPAAPSRPPQMPAPPAPAATADRTAAPATPGPEALDSLPPGPGRPDARPSTTAAPRADTAPPGPSSPASSGSPVRLADLVPDLRRQLPPLKLSMHLWNQAPERRLLVLDGQRLRQGDVLGEVVVERIDRDSAVLAWRGGRILLPVE